MPPCRCDSLDGRGALPTDERVDLRGFGSFIVKEKKARQSRNSRAGEMNRDRRSGNAAFERPGTPKEELGKAAETVTGNSEVAIGTRDRATGGAVLSHAERPLREGTHLRLCRHAKPITPSCKYHRYLLVSLSPHQCKGRCNWVLVRMLALKSTIGTVWCQFRAFSDSFEIAGYTVSLVDEEALMVAEPIVFNGSARNHVQSPLSRLYCL
jgi:hypothetical protein